VTSDNEQFTYVTGNDDAIPPSEVDPAPTGRKVTYPVAFAPGFRSSLIWSPGVPLHVTGIGGSFAGVTREAGNARIIGAERVPAYRLTSGIAEKRPTALRRATGQDPSDPQWTQLPTELPAAIGALARHITVNAGSRYEQVRDIVTYLRNHETYTQASPIPGNGEDAVYDFLFRDHEGFCEQFASAEAVLLRTLGVPTRVVTGLAYGDIQGRTRLFTAANAHAWDEVYYPGIGWSPSDPTLGATLAAAPTAHRALVSRLLSTLTGALPGGRTALGVMVAALLVGLVLAGRSLLRSRHGHPGRRSEPRRIGPVLAEFNRVAAHPRAPAPRAPAETAREYLGRVSAPGTLRAALEALERECYGATPPDEQATAEAVAALSAVVQSERS
jgi:transglutaminase-like putative cysteine protease